MDDISNVENRKNKLPQKHDHSQKIIIPKDTINPNETTVIEIPSHMRSKKVVIAQKAMSLKASGPKQRKTTRNETVTRGHRQRKINFKQSQKMSHESASHSPDSTSQTMLSGPAHSSNLRFADEKDIERLLDDLERYYCSQRQLLLKAKLSRASTCSCGPSNLSRIQTCSQSAASSDNSNYDHFARGLNSGKTSEEKPGSSTSTRERGTRSAPQSQVLLGIDSDLIVKVPCQAGPSHNQQVGTDVDDREESCICLLNPVDLEQIKKQFQDASRKLDDILSYQNKQCPGSKIIASSR